jgi:hypothetical protein
VLYATGTKGSQLAHRLLFHITPKKCDQNDWWLTWALLKSQGSCTQSLFPMGAKHTLVIPIPCPHMHMSISTSLQLVPLQPCRAHAAHSTAQGYMNPSSSNRQGFSVRLYASTLYAVRCTQYAARPVQYVPTVCCCTLCVPFSSVAAAGMCTGSGLALSGPRVRKGLLQHVACL